MHPDCWLVDVTWKDFVSWIHAYLYVERFLGMISGLRLANKTEWRVFVCVCDWSVDVFLFVFVLQPSSQEDTWEWRTSRHCTRATHGIRQRVFLLNDSNVLFCICFVCIHTVCPGCIVWYVLAGMSSGSLMMPQSPRTHPGVFLLQ